eukprot:787405-Prorocentrum_minimum.AAC.2
MARQQLIGKQRTSDRHLEDRLGKIRPRRSHHSNHSADEQMRSGKSREEGRKGKSAPTTPATIQPKTFRSSHQFHYSHLLQEEKETVLTAEQMMMARTMPVPVPPLAPVSSLETSRSLTTDGQVGGGLSACEICEARV